MTQIQPMAFNAFDIEVPTSTMTPISLEGMAPGIESSSEGLQFVDDAHLEVLLTVEWDPNVTPGRRFAHTRLGPDEHPLHSELIEAEALIGLSGGRQLLRGNTHVGPGRVEKMTLEVWQDSDAPVRVRRAALVLHSL